MGSIMTGSGNCHRMVYSSRNGVLPGSLWALAHPCPWNQQKPCWWTVATEARLRVLLPRSFVEALEGVIVSLALRTGTLITERKFTRAKDYLRVSVRELRIKEKLSDRLACVEVEGKLLP